MHNLFLKALTFFLFGNSIYFQLVVERMLASEGKKRVDLSRDEFTARVWEWKEKYLSSLINESSLVMV